MSLNSSGHYLRSKPEFFKDIKCWFLSWSNSQVKNDRQDSSSSEVMNIVSLLAIKTRLSEHQHNDLKVNAVGLQELFFEENNKQLNEDELVTVLQGRVFAGEQLVSDFDSKGNHQRPELLKILNNFSLWFSTLNDKQKELVTGLQEKSFRLSLG